MEPPSVELPTPVRILCRGPDGAVERDLFIGYRGASIRCLELDHAREGPPPGWYPPEATPAQSAYFTGRIMEGSATIAETAALLTDLLLTTPPVANALAELPSRQLARLEIDPDGGAFTLAVAHDNSFERVFGCADGRVTASMRRSAEDAWIRSGGSDSLLVVAETTPPSATHISLATPGSSPKFWPAPAGSSA